jgi:hypothetical protein
MKRLILFAVLVLSLSLGIKPAKADTYRDVLPVTYSVYSAGGATYYVASQITLTISSGATQGQFTLYKNVGSTWTSYTCLDYPIVTFAEIFDGTPRWYAYNSSGAYCVNSGGWPVGTFVYNIDTAATASTWSTCGANLCRSAHGVGQNNAIIYWNGGGSEFFYSGASGGTAATFTWQRRP